MKRAGRIVFNGMTILSLLLALTVAASWVRSYWHRDAVFYYPGDAHTIRGLFSSKGRFQFRILDSQFALPRLAERRWEHDPDGFSWYPPRQGFMGIGWGKIVSSGGPVWRQNDLAIPHAYLLLLFAAFPAIRVYRAFRRRRLRLPGLCPKCGYDLRATPDRCPECGTIPAKT